MAKFGEDEKTVNLICILVKKESLFLFGVCKRFYFRKRSF